MTITIGEYTTRNGCRAIVDARDGSLYSGVVITGGGLTQVRVWWDSTGAVKFPGGSWCNCNEGGVLFTYNGHQTPMLKYSNSTYVALTSTQSPFDITEPKQMKEETKSVLVQTQRLIKLSDNAWINPKEIISISAHQKHSHGTIFQDRVAINYAGELYSTINCTSLEEAKKLADELAEKVNSIK